MDLHAILATLARERPVFYSEADFQFALAWRIRETTGEGVRLEYPPHRGEKKYLDIWLPESRAAIELKYWTRKLDARVAGEEFLLLEQGAQDLSRYDCLKDIQRVERVGHGFVVALTNDHLHWKPPLKKGTIDAAFRIHRGRRIRAKDELRWHPRASTETMKGREDPICLRHDYELSWRDYGRPITDGANTKHGQFRYLAVEVPPRGCGSSVCDSESSGCRSNRGG